MALLRLSLFCCLSLCLLPACGGDPELPDGEEVTVQRPAVDSMPPAPATPPLAAGDKVNAWVDGLFVRAQPNKTGTIVAQVRAGTALEFTGKRSDTEETIVLRGMAFAQPWLEVRTAEGQQGWVFGGAVQRSGERKGNGFQSAQQFDFPDFGSFDLRNWEQQPAQETAGGDATITLTVYEKNGQRLAVKETETGEHGYERLYTLTTSGGKLLKTRKFTFAAEPSPQLTEVVTDYGQAPPRVRRRTQPLSQHVLQLNGRPELAVGTWEDR